MNRILKGKSRYVFVFVLALLLFAGVMPVTEAYSKTKVTTVKGRYYQSDARKMLKKVNNFRTGKNAWYYKSEGSNEKVRLKHLSKLKYDYKLEEIAMRRAAEISVSFSHTRPNGKSCFSLYPDGYYAMGENIAAGSSSYTSTFKMWQETNESYNFQGHRRNMLGSQYTSIGIACFEVKGRKYWVMELSSPKSSAKKKLAVDGERKVQVKVKGSR